MDKLDKLTNKDIDRMVEDAGKWMRTKEGKKALHQLCKELEEIEEEYERKQREPIPWELLHEPMTI